MNEPNKKRFFEDILWFGQITDNPEGMKAGSKGTFSPPVSFPLFTKWNMKLFFILFLVGGCQVYPVGISRIVWPFSPGLGISGTIIWKVENLVTNQFV